MQFLDIMLWIIHGAVYGSLLVLPFNLHADQSKDECYEWFADNGVKPGKDCFSKCATLKIDMGTFACPNFCGEFCKKSGTTDFLFKLSDLYPGLTNSERALAAENPAEALKGYVDSWRAEKTCANEFGASRNDDESDACRHFLWAGMMDHDIGSAMAKKFLNAHEDFEDNPPDDKKMDLANNKKGLAAAEKMIHDNDYSTDSLKQEFDRELNKGELTVIKPRLGRGSHK